MSGIFISYRRDDTRGTTGRLYDVLSERFGREHVFRDVDAIQPGAIFGQRIEDAIAGCQAVVVVIGTGWLRPDAAGRRRIDDQADLVRREVASALAQDKVVVPVLVEDAAMPSEGDLPADLASLAGRNALSLSDQRWDYDTGLLVKLLEPLLPHASGSTPAVAASPTPAGTVEPSPQPLRPSARAWSLRPPAFLAYVVFASLALGAVLANRSTGGDAGAGDRGAAVQTDATDTTAPGASAGSTAPSSTTPPGAIPIAVGDTVGNGSPAGAGSITAPGAKQTYSFAAKAGQILYLKEVYEGACCDLQWELLAPSGSKIAGANMINDLGRVTLSQSGTHTIVVSSSGGGTGTYGFELAPVPPDSTFAISIGATVGTGNPPGAGTIAAAGARQSYTFTGAVGQVLYLKEVYDGPCCEMEWQLLAPSGSRIAFANMINDLGRVTLSQSGTHTIVVSSGRRGTGTYGFVVSAVP